jgi:hypothetical protein
MPYTHVLNSESLAPGRPQPPPCSAHSSVPGQSAQVGSGSQDRPTPRSRRPPVARRPTPGARAWIGRLPLEGASERTRWNQRMALIGRPVDQAWVEMGRAAQFTNSS